MAFDKEKMRKTLAAKFGAIKESDVATDKAAEAIAAAVAEAIGDLEVEVQVTVNEEIAQVPATLAIDKTMKGGVK